MFFQLETRNDTLMSMFKIPLIGVWIYLLVVMVPTALAWSMLASLLSVDDKYVPTSYLLFAAAVNLVLWLRGTKFKVFWLPFWLIMLVLGTMELVDRCRKDSTPSTELVKPPAPANTK